MAIPNSINITFDATNKEMIIYPSPLAVQPTGVSASLVGGGSLVAGTTLYYKIVAVGYNGESIASTEVSSTPSGGNKSIAITWSAQTTYGTVAEYHIYKSTVSGTYISGYFRSVTNSFTDDGSLTLNHATLGSGSEITNPQITAIKYDDINKIMCTFIPAYNNQGQDARPSVTRMHITDKCNKEIICFDLKRVANQPTWKTGTQAGCAAAEYDVRVYTA